MRQSCVWNEEMIVACGHKSPVWSGIQSWWSKPLCDGLSPDALTGVKSLAESCQAMMDASKNEQKWWSVRNVEYSVWTSGCRYKRTAGPQKIVGLGKFSRQRFYRVSEARFFLVWFRNRLSLGLGFSKKGLGESRILPFATLKLAACISSWL